MFFSNFLFLSDSDNTTEVVNKRTGNVKFLTDDEIIAQCMFFFIAGFETTSGTMTNAFFHLAKDQQIQDRLYDELAEKLSDIDPNNLEEYYEVLNKIPYLDAIVKETLRLYPPAPKLERRVGSDTYTLAGVKLQKDDAVEVSVVGIHYNPEYFEDPYRFNPDRFMPENKHKLVPYSFLSFGDGPRNCVGMRFAYQEAKIGIASMIRRFRFDITDKTPESLQFPKKNGVLIPLPFDLKVGYRN